MTSIPPVDPTQIDKLLLPYDRSNAPGFAVGVALRGRPAYRRGVGMASIELPVVLSPTIRMRIGSTSKHFTVLAVMLLMEEGRLSIEESPRRLLPELPDWAESMSIRQLMSHTSGMRDSLDLILHASGPGIPAPVNYQLQTLAGLDSVNFAPGSTWNYNNGGYVLLAEIVARVSGQPFADFLRDRIFRPVGMNDTLLRALDTDLISNSATLHVALPTGSYVRGVFGVPIGGEGGIVSTVDDMLRWLRHMSHPLVGTSESWATMRTPVASHGYGLGLITNQHRGLTTVHHAGAVVGGSCQMLKVVDHELDIIVMSNGLGGLDLHRLVESIIDCCIPDLPPPPDDVVAPPVNGTYYSHSSGRILALGENEGKQTLRIGGMTLPARRDADGALSIPLVPTDMRVTPAMDGGSIRVEEYGNTDILSRVEPVEGRSALPPVGRYGSPAAAIAAEITAGTETDARLVLTGVLGSMEYALTLIGPELWEGRATGTLPLAVTIEIDVEGFLLTSGRTQRLRFEKL